MNTQPGGVSVLAANLAQTDRRALSQAWYSSLHVPEKNLSHTPSPARHAAGAAFSNAVAAHRSEASRNSAALASPVRRHAERSQAAGQPPERRAPKTELARRIERVVEQQPQRKSRASSISVKTSGGRIQLLVRHDGSVTRIVALCAPPLKERVERALAQARFALAAGGAHIGTCA